MRPLSAACLGVAMVCFGFIHIGAAQPIRVWDHGSHTHPSSDERALRELLGQYGSGDIDGAVRGILANPPRWMGAALDSTVRRIDEEITYHRRPVNRKSLTLDERLERFLRADRLNVLRLAAALQVDASRALTDIDVVGRHLLNAERAIDRLYELRADFAQNGRLPWPVGVHEPWDSVTGDEPQRTADWPAVRSFVQRWYSAVTARLQELVELRLAPALIARGLSRFPGDPNLLLARGWLVETRLALAQVDASFASVLYASDLRQRWRDELSEAASDFEHAVQTAGPSSEAAVRLARVRLLNGQATRARDLLDRALASDMPVEIRYLALLFRAAAAERAGDLEAAGRDYDDAVRAVPGAQTPMLALARLADERNETSDARTWVERAFSPATRAVDPWRRYIQGQAWQLGDRVASLRTLEPR